MRTRILNKYIYRYSILGLFGLSVGIFALLLVLFFENVPLEGNTLAIDWKRLWFGIQNGKIVYGNQTGLRIPPWSLILVLPLGFLPLKTSWGILNAGMFFTLITSIPKGKGFWLKSLLLTLSFPALRTAADGNFELLVILGLILILKSFGESNELLLAVGILLACTKIQEVWILFLVLPVFILHHFPFNSINKTAVFISAAVIPGMLWKGREWVTGMLAIQERGSIMDVSLWAAFERYGVPTIISILFGVTIFVLSAIIAIRYRSQFNRSIAALLVSSSLLLAPYSAGNSFLTVYALGIIPLLSDKALPAIFLIILTNFPYLVLSRPDIQYQWGAGYTTLLLMITWLVLSWVYILEIREKRNT